ncbi:MAG: acetyl-CoA carboxylase carboxyltransferase subunit alpha [Candidatus Melainabacteria bacterium]|nr:acetyl-CoA carboxylase carboxyltransferase subunit alpha [Candidatus Melainabacteria bacterium]
MSTLSHEKQILEYEKTLAQLKEQNKENALWSDDEISNLESKLEQLRSKVYSQLTPWERVQICRHPQRPKAIDYIKHMCEEFTELYGDRLFRDDRAVICGLAKIDGAKFMVIAQEKGNDTKSRLERNFGMMHPEGYRKAMRCMRMAAKFKIPVLSLIDTPGAHPGLAAEERGQGWAIAQNLWEMARLPTPIICILIGEGCSGGALGVGVGDVVAMLQHSYYAVISPESCASIIWRDNNKKELAAQTLRMHAEDLMKLDIVDAMIEEPMGGAHRDTAQVYRSVKKYIIEQWNILKTVSPELLIEQRYQKFRRIGKFSVEQTK